MRDRASVHTGIKTHTFTSSAPIIMYLIQINRLRATQRNEETNNNLMYHLLLLNTYYYIRKLKIKQQKEGDRTITKVYKHFTTYFLLTNTYHLILIDINHAAMPHSSLSSILSSSVISFSYRIADKHANYLS